MAIYLQITEGAKIQKIRPSFRTIYIGRSSKCHITLDSSIISARHLTISTTDRNHVTIKDLGSTNGTYLNGNLIDEALLYLDDIIQIGDVTISLLQSYMTPQERKTHQRDLERTNITYISFNNSILDNIYQDGERPELDTIQSLNLLTQIRKRKEASRVKSPTIIAQASKEKEDHINQPTIIFNRDDLTLKFKL